MTMLNGEPIETPDISTASAASSTTPGVPPRQDPAVNALGLVSLILAIVFPLAGMILGGIAMSQAKKAGASSALAKAGFWVGLVLTVLILAVVIVMIVLGANLFGLFTSVFEICQQLGPGVHQENGVTYECNT